MPTKKKAVKKKPEVVSEEEVREQSQNQLKEQMEALRKRQIEQQRSQAMRHNQGKGMSSRPIGQQSRARAKRSSR